MTAPAEYIDPNGATALVGAPAAVFLARHGYAAVRLQPLTSDASTRRYFRLPDQGLLLMDDQTDPGSVAAYVGISRHLLSLGLSAPVVHGVDASAGLALVEDFGDATYAACLTQGESEETLYALAVDTLLQLHADPRAAAIGLPRYDLATHLRELAVFTDWFAAALLPAADVPEFRRAFLACWSEALSDVAPRAETLVLRDFHIDNLMLLGGRAGAARCGLLDFQDALLGPSEHDLVSLLQDARRDLASGLEAAMLERYLAAAHPRLGGTEDIRRRYALLGAQRHARIAGVFVRLYQRDGKPRYLGFLPRVLRQLEQALADAGLADIAACLNEFLPDWRARGAVLTADDLQAIGNPNV